MRILLLSFLSALFIALPHASAFDGKQSGDVLIKNVTIVSSHLKTPLIGQNVHIANGRIASISPKSIDVSNQTQTIDGTNQYLTPGIMDGHIHVSSIAGLGFTSDIKTKEHPVIAKSYLEQEARSHLYHGITQLLDPNPGASWEQYLESPVRPTAFRCEVITSPETFPYIEKPAAIAAELFPYVISETEKNKTTPSIEKTVQDIAASGAICIKLYFEDGYGNSSEWPLLKPETIAQITSDAKKHNLFVMAHVNATDMYQAALASDIDILAHGIWNWGADNRSRELPESVKQVLDTVLKKKIGFMPSQRVMAGLGELMLPETLEDPKLKKIVPADILNWYRQDEAGWFKSEIIQGFDNLPPEQIAAIVQYGFLRRGRDAMLYLHQAGHPMLLGSDTPSSPSYANQPGLNSYQELVMMAEAGIPLNNVLEAATINNALQFKLNKDFGTVETGKIANLLLLTKNPLETVEAWDNIDTVILNGKPIARESLSAQNK